MGGWVVGGEGSEGDDPSPAVALHVGNHRLAKMDDAHKVHIHRFAPFIRSDRQEVLGRRTASVGYTNVDTSKAFRDLLHESLHRGYVSHVQGFRIDFSAGLLAEF